MNPGAETAGPDLGLTTILAAISLIAVWIPLWRGLRLCFRARSATALRSDSELQRVINAGGSAAPNGFAELFVRTFSSSLRESSGESVPAAFVMDAARQYAMNEYESNYAKVVSMYANLLPPIGFIGTTSGMLILFLSMHLANSSLELGALAVALTSSIFALIGFAFLEGFKIRIYGRLLECLDSAGELAQRESIKVAAAS